MQCVVSRACPLITVFKAGKHCGACTHTQEAGVQPIKRKGEKKKMQRYWVCSRPRRKSALSVRTKKKKKKANSITVFYLWLCEDKGEKKKKESTKQQCTAVRSQLCQTKRTHHNRQRENKERKQEKAVEVHENIKSQQKKKEGKKKSDTHSYEVAKLVPDA